MNDFTSSEAVSEPRLGNSVQDDVALGLRIVTAHVVKTVQGLGELGASTGLVGPVGVDVGDGVLWGSTGVLTQSAGFFFRCLLTSFRVSMIGVSRRGSRSR